MEKNTPESPIALERRKHPRFLVELPLEYRRAIDSRMRPAHTLNFSEDGLTVSVSEKMEIGEKLEIRIYFSSDSSLITIAATAMIAWGDTEGKGDGCYRFGLSFVNIPPADMERLKGFLNQYADPNKTPAELKSFPGNRFNPTEASGSESPASNPTVLTPFMKLFSFGRRAMGKEKR